jgi:hypothetical protein
MRQHPDIVRSVCGPEFHILIDYVRQKGRPVLEIVSEHVRHVYTNRIYNNSHPLNIYVYMFKETPIAMIHLPVGSTAEIEGYTVAFANSSVVVFASDVALSHEMFHTLEALSGSHASASRFADDPSEYGAFTTSLFKTSELTEITLLFTHFNTLVHASKTSD